MGSSERQFSEAGGKGAVELVGGHTVYGQLMPVLSSFWSMNLTSDLEDP